MIFLSYASEDTFEAELLQFAFETLFTDLNVKVWTYERDQSKSEMAIASSLKQRVRSSSAMCFLVSDATVGGGATQWMELAYADAFEVPSFVLLHRLTYDKLKAPGANAPPLLLDAQCNLATAWRDVAAEIRQVLET